MRGFGVPRRRTAERPKVALLVPGAADGTGSAQAAVARANALAGAFDVELVSVVSRAPVRPEGLADTVHLRHLSAPRSGGVAEVELRITDPEALAGRPSRLVPSGWDPTVDALSDAALSEVLPHLEADVVVSTSPGMLAACAQLLPAGTALVHEETGTDAGGLSPALLAFAGRVDVVATPSEAAAAGVREALGARAPVVRVAPYPPPRPSGPPDAAAHVILGVGGRQPEQQPDHLVRAFGRIAERLPDWRLRIPGPGPGRPRLEAIARRAGFGDRLEVTGPVDRRAALSAAGIAALPARSLGRPAVLLDVLASGVPVVAYDCPTMPAEVISHGVTGFLAPPDEGVLAEHLLRLGTDPALRARVGLAAQEWCAQFDAVGAAQTWCELVAEAAERRTPRVTATVADADEPPPAPTHLTPAASRRTLLVATAGLLTGLEGWFVLPSRQHRPPTIVVADTHRADLLSKLGAGGLARDVSIVVGPEDHWLPQRGGVRDMCEALARRMVLGFTIEPWPGNDDRRSHLCDGSGVRVEFWLRTADGSLHAARPNPFSLLVRPDDVRAGIIDDVRVPTLALSAPFSDECAFPIDAVFTWVDDRDPAWRAAKASALRTAEARDQALAASGDARFRDRDELRYSLRSLHVHAPWIRMIHLVTAGQRPSWLVDDPRVRVVDHAEILPPDALPTFNSHAIETALHRIPGLAEQFVYLNDDFFLGRPVRPEQFFSPGGIPAVFAAPGPIGLPTADDVPYVGAAHTNRNLLSERFGATITQHLFHTPYPHRRSVVEAVAASFPDAVARTARNRFRSSDDVSMLSSLAQHFGLLSGTAYDASITTRFVDSSRPNIGIVLRELLRRDVDTFCIADHHDYALPQEQVAEMLAAFFEQYFPVRPPWESAV